jgi:hypothetical protein
MFWRRRQRLDEEIEAHLAEETADNIARGMDPQSARRAALRTFGNVAAVQERSRQLDPLYWLDTLRQDARFACRLIARNRWVSLTVVATRLSSAPSRVAPPAAPRCGRGDQRIPRAAG